MNKCPWYKKCRNGNDKCYSREPEKCVRFLPLEGTNLTKISGVIETPPEIDSDKFSQYFINWIESMGWSFAGSFSSENDDYKTGSTTVKNNDSKICPTTISPDFKRGKSMGNLRFRCLAKVLSDEDYKVIRDFVGFNFYDENGYISGKAIKNIYERMPEEELERLFQKYGILEVMSDDGKHCLADGDPLPKPNVQLLIYCAENSDSVGSGAATLGADGKWYWTYDMRIHEPCEYTVTHWRYL